MPTSKYLSNIVHLKVPQKLRVFDKTLYHVLETRFLPVSLNKQSAYVVLGRYEERSYTWKVGPTIHQFAHDWTLLEIIRLLILMGSSLYPIQWPDIDGPEIMGREALQKQQERWWRRTKRRKKKPQLQQLQLCKSFGHNAMTCKRTLTANKFVGRNKKDISKTSTLSHFRISTCVVED